MKWRSGLKESEECFIKEARGKKEGHFFFALDNWSVFTTTSEWPPVPGPAGACQRAGGGVSRAEPPQAAGTERERVPEGRAGRPAQGQRGHGEGAA